MIRYTGALNKETEQRVKENLQFLKSLFVPLGQGKSSTAVTTIKESIEKYNAGITTEEIQAWVWYRKLMGIPMKAWKEYDVKFSESKKIKLVQKGVLFYSGKGDKLEPFPVFVFGNIYTKKSQVIKNKDKIIESFGASVYENHLKVLDKHKPPTLSIQNPMIGERPIILAISETARSINVSSLRSDSGVILAATTSLQDAYKEWLKAQDATAFKKTTAYEIISYYLNGEQKPRSIDKIEWGAIKKLTKEQGENLFKKFLHEALEREDQIKIDEQYNRKYNGTAPLQYQKIPIGMEVSRYFGKHELSLFPAQREGVAFMELVGSGIIAYDVGVGKTITAIIELASAINNGKCKRPLVVVPNPTYKNWIKELIGEDEDDLKGILSGTGIKLNTWFNLGKDYDHVNMDKAVDEKTITLVTYQGLEKIGFNEHTQDDHFRELANILGQVGKGERDTEKENEKFREIIGVGLKETIGDIETLGFDYVVVDEAHNFKNVFTSVKSDEGNKKQFEIKGGATSNRAIKLFFLCNYVQRTYGRNVMLLTATPFTNSPLEIYSMLSFVAYDYMVANNILNIRQFFEQYIQETFDYVVGIDGEIKQKAVVKSFNNRLSLQKLIASHINFKTGEEANIPRPCKINLPKTTKSTDTGLEKLKKDDQILTYLELTPEQMANQRQINEAASKGASKDDPGKLLRLMSQSLNNALTPFLYDGIPADYKDFVENSPKILYTLNCVRDVKEWHKKRDQEVSGQVIYIDRGKGFFKYIKQYLEEEIGYKKKQPLLSNPRKKVDEVEIITGDISSANKEKIKDAFNEGVCKIIIGTSTIKEGINLQKKSTVLYNLYPNWNPTDIRQLEGRIWRQKNEYGYVRIVMPLMENSMDVFVFQKLEEKTSRINDLWSKSDRGNVLDEESLDPNEVKFALVTDLNVLLRFELKQISEDLGSKQSILNSQITDLDNYDELKRRYSGYKERIIQNVNQFFNSIRNSIVFSSTPQREMIRYSDVPSLDLESETKEIQTLVERWNKCHALLNDVTQGNHEDKAIIIAYNTYNRLAQSYSGFRSDWHFDQYKDTVSQLNKLERSLFKNRGYDNNTDVLKIKNELEKELEEVVTDVEELQTEDFQEKVYNQIKAQKEKLAIKGGDLDSRVRDFSSLNYLLSYKFTDVDPRMCTIPTSELKKVVPAQNKKLKLAKAKMKMLKLKLALTA